MGLAETLSRKLERFSKTLKNKGSCRMPEAPKPDMKLQLDGKNPQQTPVKK